MVSEPSTDASANVVGLVPVAQVSDCPTNLRDALVDVIEQAFRAHPPLIRHGQATVQMDLLVALLDGAMEAFEGALANAFKVGVWTKDETEGMAAAFARASERHGHYESLFAVAAFILRHRLSALQNPAQDGSEPTNSNREGT